MKISNKLIARLQNAIFILLLITVIGLSGWVSERYSFEIDLTAGHRNSLTKASISVVSRLNKSLSITTFVRDSSKGTRDRVNDLVERYRRHKPDIQFKSINPDLAPQLVREHGISVDGEILVRYDKRQETLKNASEKSLTQLLMRLANDESGYIVFTEGHGERKPLSQANRDLGELGQRLISQGFNIQSLNLARTLSIPDNTKILAIVSAQTNFLPGEIKIIEQYLDQGGNLLWLTEPDRHDGLKALAAMLNIKRLPGIVVDATTQLFGISDPTFALAMDYPRHSITEQLHSQTLFPRAVGLMVTQETAWQTTAILNTLERSWTELDVIEGDIRFNPDTKEHAGPITIGIALQKTLPAADSDEPETVQRVVVIGDGDFASNTYIGNGQNMDMATALFKWLSRNEQFIDIGIVSAPDSRLEISQTGAVALLLVYMLLLPLGLLMFGIVIWLKRRNS